MYTCMFPFAKHGIQSSNTASQKIHAKQHQFVLLNFQFWKAYIILTKREMEMRGTSKGTEEIGRGEGRRKVENLK